MFDRFKEYVKYGAGRPPGTMWAMEKSYFEWKHKYPNRHDYVYLQMALQSRYPLRKEISAIAGRCTGLDDAIIEAVRLDFGEFVARMFESALNTFPPCSVCGQFRALSTVDTLCYECRTFGDLVPCHKCRLYWEKDAKYCQKCGAVLSSEPAITPDKIKESVAQLLPTPERKSEFVPRFDFSDEELSRFAITFLLVGEWTDLASSEEDAAESVMAFIDRLRQTQIERQDIVKQVFFPLQMLLMARRYSDFKTIQQEPAFSKTGQSSLQRLFASLLSKGRGGFIAEWTDTFSHSDRQDHKRTDLVALAGGPGFSKDSAIIAKGVDNEVTIFAEYWYLAYRYGRMGLDWRLGLQALLKRDQNGKMYDVFKVELSDGRCFDVYFDISHLPYSTDAGI